MACERVSICITDAQATTPNHQDDDRDQHHHRTLAP